MLIHILDRYSEGISYFGENFDLRISYSYVLNDLALLKTLAIQTAQFVKNVSTSLSQDIKVHHLLKYLEEEEVSHSRGLMNVTREQVSQKTVTQVNFTQETELNQTLEVKIFIEKDSQARQDFISKIEKALTVYEQFWSELNTETPQGSRI